VNSEINLLPLLTISIEQERAINFARGLLLEGRV